MERKNGGGGSMRIINTNQKREEKIKEYIGNIKTIKKFKNESSIFKKIIISQDRMDMFEKNRKKAEKDRNQNKNQNRNQRKIVKYSLLDWLVNYILNPIKNCKKF